MQTLLINYFLQGNSPRLTKIGRTLHHIVGHSSMCQRKFHAHYDEIDEAQCLVEGVLWPRFCKGGAITVWVAN
jgi:hypothetical protein